MSDLPALKTSLGAVWVQPDGPNTQPHYVGCVDVGDFTDPRGESELIQCFSPMGGWVTKGQKYSPPGPVTTQIDELLTAQRSYLEQIDYLFTLFILMRDGGRPDIFQNYVRAYLFQNAKVTSANANNLVHHTEDNESMQQLPISADNPVLRTGRLTGAKISVTETYATNAIFFRPSPLLWNKINVTDKVGKEGIIVCDGFTAVTANVKRTTNSGATWTNMTSDPFAAAKNIECGIGVFIDKDTVRWIVAQTAAAGGQGIVAYTDDNGATWTTANVGGATDGHGAMAGGAHALFAIDQYNIFLASDLGYIYKSSDGGATWTAVESGVITTNGWQAIYFADSMNGMVVSELDEIAITHDGGLTWTEVTATGAGGVLVNVAKAGGFWWVYEDGNTLWYSSDDGVTWTQRTGYTGAGTGVGKDLVFVNSLVGFMLYNNATPDGYILRTIDGGYTWEVLTFVANAGLNSLCAPDMNTVYAVGEVDGSAPAVLKYTWA